MLIILGHNISLCVQQLLKILMLIPKRIHTSVLILMDSFFFPNYLLQSRNNCKYIGLYLMAGCHSEIYAVYRDIENFTIKM